MHMYRLRNRISGASAHYLYPASAINPCAYVHCYFGATRCGGRASHSQSTDVAAASNVNRQKHHTQGGRASTVSSVPDADRPGTEEQAQSAREQSIESGARSRDEVREQLIQAILSHDKEIVELKRQHELSMLRVEQNQRRILKDQEDRGMYYEQNCNVHTFDTISVGLYSQRSALHHTMGLERLRNFKILLTALFTIGSCSYLYYRYMINPDFEYVEKPLKMLGSRVQAIHDILENRKLVQEERPFTAASAPPHVQSQ